MIISDHPEGTLNRLCSNKEGKEYSLMKHINIKREDGGEEFHRPSISFLWLQSSDSEGSCHCKAGPPFSFLPLPTLVLQINSQELSR
jgi:hypothetical protein